MYTCQLHSWQSISNPCPSCVRTIPSTTTNDFIVNPTPEVGSNHLLPCPFCGSNPEWINLAHPSGIPALQCSECQFSMQQDRRDKTIYYWNRRAKVTPVVGKTMEDVREVVFTEIGFASMCWSETPTGIFDASKAEMAGNLIMAAIERYCEAKDAEIERLRLILEKTFKNDHNVFYRSVSTMTAREISDLGEERWEEFKTKNELFNKKP